LFLTTAGVAANYQGPVSHPVMAQEAGSKKQDPQQFHQIDTSNSWDDMRRQMLGFVLISLLW
jgi:hypothetical protein